MYITYIPLQGGLRGQGLYLNMLLVRAGIWIIGNTEKEDQKMTAMKGNGSCLHFSLHCNLFIETSYTVSTLNCPLFKVPRRTVTLKEWNKERLVMDRNREVIGRYIISLQQRTQY